jgi:hypothetical protein
MGLSCLNSACREQGREIGGKQKCGESRWETEDCFKAGCRASGGNSTSGAHGLTCNAWACRASTVEGQWKGWETEVSVVRACWKGHCDVRAEIHNGLVMPQQGLWEAGQQKGRASEVFSRQVAQVGHMA